MDDVDFSVILKYDEKSPSCLTWKITTSTRAVAGQSAGTIDFDGYWVVRYKGKGYKAHRIILILDKINISGKQVDYIDGNRLNNLKSNLRVVSPAVNSRNVGKNKRNTSGTTGVSRCQLKHHEYWCAIWYTTKIHYKRFNIARYGEKEAKRLAEEYRASKIEELNKLGYNYSERHGK